MEFNYECLWCHVNQAKRVAEMVGLDAQRKESILRQVLKHLSEMPYEGSNPGLMEQSWRIITREIEDDNPYKEIKQTFNDQMMEVYKELDAKLMADPSRYINGIHLAVEGNIIDYGAKHEFSKDATITRLLSGEKDNFAMDESKVLYKQLKEAKQLLYIGDNCGEIVMDKLLIKVLREEFPDLKVIFSVRGKPILNDVTMADADQVGMEEVARVIDNGSGAPGTELSLTSHSFNACFEASDVIIAKGQGNFESLCDLKLGHLFFLFMGKCEAVANVLGVPLMSKMCTRSR